jgi:prevent-host-death family protein
MKHINTHEAKSQLSKLIAAVQAGEEVVICQAGKPVVRLAPYQAPRKKPRLGAWKDKVVLRPGWESSETDAEIEAMFEVLKD